MGVMGEARQRQQMALWRCQKPVEHSKPRPRHQRRAHATFTDAQRWLTRTALVHFPPPTLVRTWMAHLGANSQSPDRPHPSRKPGLDPAWFCVSSAKAPNATNLVLSMAVHDDARTRPSSSPELPSPELPSQRHVPSHDGSHASSREWAMQMLSGNADGNVVARGIHSDQVPV